MAIGAFSVGREAAGGDGAGRGAVAGDDVGLARAGARPSGRMPTRQRVRRRCRAGRGSPRRPGKSHAVAAALADRPRSGRPRPAWSARRCRCRRGRARPPAAANRARPGRPAPPRARPAARCASASAWSARNRDLEPVLAGVAGAARPGTGMPAMRDRGDAHERQRGGLRAEPAITAAAAGPCSASSARSVMRSQLHAGRQVGGDVGEVDVLAAGVDHQEQPSSPRLATIRSSRMPPASLVSSV